MVSAAPAFSWAADKPRCDDVEASAAQNTDALPAMGSIRRCRTETLPRWWSFVHAVEVEVKLEVHVHLRVLLP